MIDDLFAHIEANRDDRIARLADFLRVPSVSTDPAYKGHIDDAARFTADWLERLGMNAQVLPTEGHPCVVGDDDDAPDGAPHVLFYGHYDVQPPDPLELWTTPPFEPTIRDGAIYARGASDDKGQVACFLEALAAWREARGKLPIKLTVMIEGEEECGSVGLEPFIERHRDRFAADVAVVSDTSFWEGGVPAITYGLRGLLYFDVKLHGPSRDLHSGVYGGTVANPLNEMAKVLGRLFDDDHRVTIPGFYDKVTGPTDAERAAWDALGFDETRWAASVGLDRPFGQAGISTLERRWSQPSCDINGLYGGYMAEGAKTVIPSFAGAKVSFRLAPDQEPEAVAEAFETWLENRTPPGCRWAVRRFGSALPVVIDTDSPHLAAARRAMAAGCGRDPVLVREGATIPVVASFKNQLGVDTLLMGFGRHDDAIHSPNEKFELTHFDMGCRSHAALIAELAGSGA